ncbi:MAG TPA: lactonase family protein [Pirellulaceae bacterium]|jgi:6-phosphogluconolactonase|nr:lactonase family protein [Pirellulaceae bacterium]
MSDLLRLLLIVACVAPAVLAVLSARGEEQESKTSALRVYFGTYSGGQGQGIFMAKLDPATGRLFDVEHAGEAVKPSFLALHPNGKYLYAVSEVDDMEGMKQGGVIAYSIDPATGKLTKLNHQSSEGTAPCYVAVHPSGDSLYVANYSAGTVAGFPIKADGTLGPATSRIQHEGSGPDKGRQDAPHAHSINLSSDGRFAYACDLGTDQVLIYQVDPKSGKLTPHQQVALPPGSGPRHLSFHPNGKLAFVINELSNTLTTLTVDSHTGAMKIASSVPTLPKGFDGKNTTAEVVVHPNGKFVYGSNRGHDSIAIFALDQASGELTPRGFASESIDEPRNFRIDPTGKYLLVGNQKADSIVVYAIDQETGALTLTDAKVEIPTPVCVRFAVGK